MKVLVDMNLSPDWVTVLQKVGHETVHWSKVGSPQADDSIILGWARQNGYLVFTHDLDFGTLLALTRENGPSVIQVRTQDVLPSAISPLVIGALRQFETELDSGALIVVDESRIRARVLPLT